ncbi:MAG TPA: hypothetical protein VEA69_01765 [Tepidisphaeraceae bacterium]|nr:hypothetical protein [Tepidisphaeraceae bacterium]
MAKRKRKTREAPGKPAVSELPDPDERPRITAVVKLDQERKYLNLLHAAFALHDRFFHDQESITFRRPDGMSFHVSFCLNYVWFGPDGANASERFWTENVPIGTIDELLGSFIEGRYEVLREFGWVGRPTAVGKRRMR